MSRREFGSIRKLSSGRWQARYLRPDGFTYQSAGTFATKADARAHLRNVEADQDRGAWLDPRKGAVPFDEFAAAWLETRTVAGRPLRPRTRANYATLLTRYINPTLGRVALSDITPERVRMWHARVTKVGATTAAQSYRCLHAILQTATDEGIYAANPCRLRGAGNPRAAERPLVTPEQAEAIADAMPGDLRAMVILGFWGSLRLGELLALEWRCVDLDAFKDSGSVRIDQAQQDVAGKTVVGPPKADSVRTVHLPPVAIRELRHHREISANTGPTDRVFTRRDGSLLRHWDIHRYWRRARIAAGIADVRPHDLRHGGLTLAAQSGATLAEVMRRAGHSSSAAAMRYQHAAEDRDRELAERLEQEGERRRRQRSEGP